MTRGKRKSRDILGRFSALSMAAVVLLSAFSTIMSSAISAAAASSTATTGESFYIHKGKDLNAGDFDGTVRVKFTSDDGSVIESFDIENSTTSTGVSSGSNVPGNRWYKHSSSSDIQAWADPNGVARLQLTSSYANQATKVVVENIPTANANLEVQINGLYDDLGENELLLLIDTAGGSWTTPKYYTWNSSTNQNNAAYPGQSMTQVGNSTFYYATVNTTQFNYVIFSNGSNQNQKTVDLSLASIENRKNNTYSWAIHDWTNFTASDYSVTLSLSDRQNNHCGEGTSNDFYLTAQNRAQWSEYSSDHNMGDDNHGTSDIYFLPASKWTSAYVHFDDSDPYHRHLPMDVEFDGTSGTVFKANVPTGVQLAFSQNETLGTGSSDVRNVPWSQNIDSYNTYVSRDRQWNTLDYAIALATVSSSDIQVGSLKNHSSDNIVGINATYFDYYSNNELSQGWRNGLVGVQFDNNTYREQFTSFNDYIMNYAEANTAWRYPLVFGDLYTTGYMPTGSTASSYWTNYLSNNGNGADSYVFKRINNSNFMTSGPNNSVVNGNASIQGIVDSTLTNNNLTANGVALPYFDYDLLHNEDESDEGSSGETDNTTEGPANGVYIVGSMNNWTPQLESWQLTNIDNNKYEGTFTITGSSTNPQFKIWYDNSYYSANYWFTATNTVASGLSTSYQPNMQIDCIQESGTITINVVYYKEYSGSPRLELTQTAGGSGTTGTYAKVISSSFPFKVEDIANGNGAKKYSFDSNNASAWFSVKGNKNDGRYNDSTSEDNLQMNYSTANGDKMRNGLDTDSPGFYPFNTPKNDETWDINEPGYDYGFGVRMDMEFTLPTNGKYNDTTPAEFTFTGDDDLWVFIDGQLILDLGGNHSKTTGSINFGYAPGQISATANQVDYIVNQEKGDPDVWGGETSITKHFNFNNQDSAQKHIMTIFYMERGANDSNISMEFSVEPVVNDLYVQKEVEVPDDINTGVESDVNAKINGTESYTSNPESFGFNLKQNSNNYTDKPYDLTDANNKVTEQTITAGNFTLRDDYMAGFSDDLEYGDSITIAETSAGTFKYDTTARIRDNGTESIEDLSLDTNRSATFDFINSTDDSDPTSKIVYYKNTLKTSSFSLSKVLQTQDGNDTDETYPFTFNIQVDLDGEGGAYTYQNYSLEYTVSNSQTTALATHTATNGRVILTPGQVATFSGIPEGATVRITESVPAGYKFHQVEVNGSTSNTNQATATLGSSNTKVIFTNRINPGSGYISVNKTLDDSSYTPIASTNPTVYKAENFSFTADLIDIVDTKLTDEAKTEMINSSEYTLRADQTNYQTTTGRYQFSAVQLTPDADHAGSYIFKLSENALTGDSANKYNIDTTEYYAVLVVTEGSASFEINYYKNYDLASHTLSNPVNQTEPTTPPTFNNTTAIKYTDVTFNKVSNSGTGLNGVQFTLYTDEACTHEGVNDNDSPYNVSGKEGSQFQANVTSTTVNGTDGTVTFKDLRFDPSGDNEIKVTYYFKETKTVSGYQLIPGTYKIEIKGENDYTIFYSPTGAAADYQEVSKTGNTYSITNNALPDLPLAGGSGVVPIVVTGVGLVLLSGAGYVIYRRRQRSSTY